MDKNRNSKIASKVNAQNQKQCNSTQDMTKQRISEFEDRAMETSKTKICKEKKKGQNTPKLWDNYKMCQYNVQWEYQKQQ